MQIHLGRAYHAPIAQLCISCLSNKLYLIVGFHQKRNSSVNRRHPSLWIFIRKMKDEQSNIDLSAAGAQNGNQIRPKSASIGKWGKKSSDFGGNTTTE